MNIFLTTSYSTRVLPSHNNDENTSERIFTTEVHSPPVVFIFPMQTKLKLIHKSINHNNVDNIVPSLFFSKRTKA